MVKFAQSVLNQSSIVKVMPIFKKKVKTKEENPQFVPGSITNGVFNSQIGGKKAYTDDPSLNEDVALLTTDNQGKKIVIYENPSNGEVPL